MPLQQISLHKICKLRQQSNDKIKENDNRINKKIEVVA